MKFPIVFSNGNKVVEVSGDKYKVKLVIERAGYKFYYTLYNDRHLLTVEKLAKYLHTHPNGNDQHTLQDVVNYVRQLLGAVLEKREIEITKVVIDAEPLALGGWYEIKDARVNFVGVGGRPAFIRVSDLIVSDSDMLIRKIVREIATHQLVLIVLEKGAEGSIHPTELSEASKAKVVAALSENKEPTVYLDCLKCSAREMTAEGLTPAKVGVNFRHNRDGVGYTAHVGETPFSDLMTFKEAVRKAIPSSSENVTFTEQDSQMLDDFYFKLGLEK